jgi:hypothetical protein
VDRLARPVIMIQTKRTRMTRFSVAISGDQKNLNPAISETVSGEPVTVCAQNPEDPSNRCNPRPTEEETRFFWQLHDVIFR